MSNNWTFEEILELDLLTLTSHTLAAGEEFTKQSHAEKLKPALEKSQVAVVRCEHCLVAYAYVWPKTGVLWFVGGFGIHPKHRNAGVMRALMRKFMRIIRNNDIEKIQSNVFKTNKLSMAFHKKLGFEITRENAVGVEFTRMVADYIEKRFG